MGHVETHTNLVKLTQARSINTLQINVHSRQWEMCGTFLSTVARSIVPEFLAHLFELCFQGFGFFKEYCYVRSTECFKRQ